MMSKTHIAIGAATALVGNAPMTPGECAIAVIGGIIGGIVADNDILDNDYQGDALFGQLCAAGITALILFIDYVLDGGIVKSMLASRVLLITGIIIFAILYCVGITQPHRGFTHSILAMMLYSLAVGILYRPLMMPFALGYASHLIIDLLNKRGMALLFPLKFKICLNLCYANETANKALMLVGLVISVAMLINGLILHINIT